MKMFKTLENNKNSFWLFFMLTTKQTKAKYKSTALGFLWAFLNPLIQMIVLSIVFTLFVRLPINNYPIFALTALLPWTFFNFALLAGTYSLIENKDFLKKARFNRFLIPLSAVASNFFNFVISLILFLFYLLLSGTNLSPLNILTLTQAIVLLLTLTIALTLTLSALNIIYRDVYYLLQASLMAGFYLTPVIYPQSYVPPNLAPLFNLNPLVGIISLFRASLINPVFFDQNSILYSTIFSSILLLISFIYYKKAQKNFTDFL